MGAEVACNDDNCGYHRRNNRRWSRNPYDLGKGWCTGCEKYYFPKNKIHCPECNRKMRLKPKNVRKDAFEATYGVKRIE